MASQGTFSIREADVQDCEKIFEMKKALTQHVTPQAKMLITIDDFKRDGFGESPKIRILVAEVTKEAGTGTKGLIGYALYHFFYDYLRGSSIYLSDLYTDPSCRGRGVATSLMKHVAKVALDDPYGTLQWICAIPNPSAESFYKSLGATDSTETEQCHVMYLLTSDLESLVSRDDHKSH